MQEIPPALDTGNAGQTQDWVVMQGCCCPFTASSFSHTLYFLQDDQRIEPSIFSISEAKTAGLYVNIL